MPDPTRDRWQEQFIARLRTAFPAARIELVTEAWGGRNTSSYLGEPPGSPHNYAEKVLQAKADLIVSEFVNDAGLNPEQVEERYGRLLADFRQAGAEWIILMPHYVRPDDGAGPGSGTLTTTRVRMWRACAGLPRRIGSRSRTPRNGTAGCGVRAFRTRR